MRTRSSGTKAAVRSYSIYSEEPAKRAFLSHAWLIAASLLCVVSLNNFSQRLMNPRATLVLTAPFCCNETNDDNNRHLRSVLLNYIKGNFIFRAWKRFHFGGGQKGLSQNFGGTVPLCPPSPHYLRHCLRLLCLVYLDQSHMCRQDLVEMGWLFHEICTIP